jgi:hypothetical protein
MRASLAVGTSAATICLETFLQRRIPYSAVRSVQLLHLHVVAHPSFSNRQNLWQKQETADFRTTWSNKCTAHYILQHIASFLSFLFGKMRVTVAITFIVSCSHGFQGPQFNNANAPRTFSLSSTLSPDAPSFLSKGEDDNPEPKKGAISMQLDQLTELLGGKGRAQIVWDCYSIGIDPADYFGTINLGYDDFESIHGILPSRRRSQKLGPEALSRLASSYPEGAAGKIEGGVATLSYISKANDSTTKILLTLADGLQIETVIIPMAGDRSTLCVSSQVGCAQGCRFCATGKMGRLRNLTSAEILAQLFFAKKLCRLEGLPEITNIVFMGMGDAGKYPL